MWGKIYDTTNWGFGADNNISWGEVYREFIPITINNIKATWDSIIETWNNI